MLDYLLNLLFPAKCIICDNHIQKSGVCNECWGKFTFITKPYCAICSHPFAYENDEDMVCGHCLMHKPAYDKAISILKYDDFCKKLVHRFKYQDQLHILDYLTSLMMNMGKGVIEQADIIIPVSMHKYKLLKRGYNQAALLAMNIAKKSNITYLPELMHRTKNIQSQADLTKKQRAQNIKNSFALNPKLKNKISGKRILLIDDVITTGATIAECCKVIKSAKPSKILVLTLAKRI